MDAFKRLFGTDRAPVVLVRSLGLTLTDRAGPLKRLFLERALGLNPGLPPLARA
jgi:2-octaprenylphenol hydroxylase